MIDGTICLHRVDMVILRANTVRDKDYVFTIRGEPSTITTSIARQITERTHSSGEPDLAYVSRYAD